MVEDGGPTRQGFVQLTDLEVNVAALNALLGEGSPFRLHHGRIAKAEVRVCYEKLLTEGLRISLEGVDLVLCKASGAAAAAAGDDQPPDIAAAVRAAAEARERREQGRREEEEEEEKEKAEEDAKAAKAAAPPAGGGGGGGRRGEEEDAGGANGIIADWIEQIATHMRVEVRDLTLRVVEDPRAGAGADADADGGGGGPVLRLSLAGARYEDVTTKYQGFAAMQGSMSASFSGAGPGPAGPAGTVGPSFVSHKVSTCLLFISGVGVGLGWVGTVRPGRGDGGVHC